MFLIAFYSEQRVCAGREHNNVNIQSTTVLLLSHYTRASVQCFPSQNTNSEERRGEEEGGPTKQIKKQQKSDDIGKAS